MSTERAADESRLDPCPAEEWHRDGRGLWAMRSCRFAFKHTARHEFTSWQYYKQAPEPSELSALRTRLRAMEGAQDDKLLWTLDNVYTIARRELRRGDPREMWGHIIRLCEKVGCKPRGVLRDNGGALPSPPAPEEAP